MAKKQVCCHANHSANIFTLFLSHLQVSSNATELGEKLAQITPFLNSLFRNGSINWNLHSRPMSPINDE